MRSDKIKDLGEKLILKQFEIIGQPMVIERLQTMPNWYWEYTFTTEQSEQWREWCRKEVKKVTKWKAEKVNKELSFFFLNYELKVQDNTL